MNNVIYCELYNEVCTREWCRENPRKCGAGTVGRQDLPKTKAEELITETRAKSYRKAVADAIALIEKESEMVKEMGYKLKRL